MAFFRTNNPKGQVYWRTTKTSTKTSSATTKTTTKTSYKLTCKNQKKQEKVRQKEAILQYLDSIPTINNTEARQLLNLKDKDRSRVSRLFAELVSEGEILQTEDSRPNDVRYKRMQK